MAKAKETAKKAEVKKVSKSKKEQSDGPTKKTDKNPDQADNQKEIIEAKASETDTEQKSEPKITKAGKRSPKAIAEAELEKAKQERKTTASEEPAKPKAIQKPAKPRSERAGKKMREANKLVDNTKAYGLGEAMELAVKTSTSKFDGTVEMHINLNVDPRQADQNVRGMVVLPAGTGKSVRIAVLAGDEDAKQAKTAGAELAGEDDLLAQIEKGQFDFDILISTPALMAKLGKHARVLGPKGLMPNPKSGTVTTDVAKAVSEAKAGRVEYRVDPTGIIHVGIGKVSFGADKLQTNAEAIIQSVRNARPASIKGGYIKSGYVSATMGPGIKLSLSEPV